MASAPPVQEEPLQPGTKPFRSQLAAAVRSINWSYAIFWSISTSRPGVLTWKDGFYNGEVKTRKLSNSAGLTADEIILQRSEQLRELYSSLLSGECDHRARRPVAALWPEDLGNTEWYYVICMTYVFWPGQGLPGRSFASNGSVWLCNAQSADSKTFARALLAKTIVCVPFMSGVLELGTTDLVMEEPNLVDRITASFGEPQFSACLEVPNSSPSLNETGDADDIVLEDLIDNAIEEEQMIQPGEHELSDAVVVADHQRMSNANDGLDQITMEIDELYSLCEELDLDTTFSLEHDNSYWPMNTGSFQLVRMSSPEAMAATAAEAASDFDGVVSITSCFMTWKRANLDEVTVSHTGIESQKLLRKTLDGGAWRSNNGRGSVAMTQESSIKNHVMSERRRREKLNEMFLILKSLIPSIHKMDKASILAETITYIKELEKRVKELESNSERSHQRSTKLRGNNNINGKEIPNVGDGVGGGDASRNHDWVLSEKVPSNVNVIVIHKCKWKELMITRVFDTIKSLCLDILSVQASTPVGLFRLKIQAKFACSDEVAPERIIEALQNAIGS
uniref:BHLH domain-containing protein n=1 Tax=Leersia perrieri TaxID=77586 RepID=A0A0D9X7H8_9ORYZ